MLRIFELGTRSQILVGSSGAETSQMSSSYLSASRIRRNACQRILLLGQDGQWAMCFGDGVSRAGHEVEITPRHSFQGQARLHALATKPEQKACLGSLPGQQRFSEGCLSSDAAQ